MTTISEVNPTIFQSLYEVNPNLKLFELASGLELDTLYVYKYGDRKCDADLDSKQAATMLNIMHRLKWDNALDLWTNAYTLMQDFGSKDVTTTVKDYSYTDNVHDEKAVPAFDDVEPAIDETNAKVLTHEDTVNSTTVTKENKKIDDVNPMLDYLQRNFLDDIIFTDVNDLVTYYVHN